MMAGEGRSVGTTRVWSGGREEVEMELAQLETSEPCWAIRLWAQGRSSPS